MDDRHLRIIDPRTGELDDARRPADLRLLDRWGPDPISDDDARIDAIATVSAGYRGTGRDGKPGPPQASRDGTIYISDEAGRAPHLARILTENGSKRLRIAFPYNNPAAFIQQRFVQYSASHLLAYGDEYQLTVINPETKTRRVLVAGVDPDYDRERERCSISSSIYFTLAEWTEQGGSRVIFPDGMGFYRLRTTSRNSMQNLRASLKMLSNFTGGQIAGIPFDLEIDYREVSGPDGSKRRIPCWIFRVNPPGGLTSRSFAPILTQALREGRMLQLPPPNPETEWSANRDWALLGDDDALPLTAHAEGPVVIAPSAQEIEMIGAGVTFCDAAAAEARFFTTVRGSVLDSKAARAEFLTTYTQGRTSSLAEFLETATEADVDQLLEQVGQYIFAARKEAPAAPSDMEQAALVDAPKKRGVTGEQVAALRQLAPEWADGADWDAMSYEEAATQIAELQRARKATPSSR